MKSPYSNLGRRRGLTLVELLVVVVILVMLVAVTIPLMRSIRTGSDIDAATRKIESVMSAAKTQAIATGRPASVVFMRDEQNPNVAYQIALAESPRPYAGDFAGAKAGIDAKTFNTGTQLYEVSIVFNGSVRSLRPNPASETDESTWFVRPGDTIRFNFRGHKFNISDVVDERTLIIADFREVPLPIGQLASFQIFRAPRRNSSAPEELPLGSFVVLNAPPLFLGTDYDYSSGATYHGYNESKQLVELMLDQTTSLFPYGDVMVTFSPQGIVERLHRGIPSQDLLDAMKLMGKNVPRTVNYPLNPVRITVGNGSPDKPDQVLALLVKKGREHKATRVPLPVPDVPESGASVPISTLR